MRKSAVVFAAPPAWAGAERGGRYECPNCGGSHSMVTDSRPSRKGVRRRRCCQGCHARWTTFEASIDIGRITDEYITKLLKNADALEEMARNLRVAVDLIRDTQGQE